MAPDKQSVEHGGKPGHNQGGIAAGNADPRHEGRHFSWLGLVGVALALALAAAVVVQARQFKLLGSDVQTSDDLVLLVVHQAEADYRRLREVWQEALLEMPRAEDGERLRQRYGTWVGCIAQLQGERPQRLLAQSPGHQQTLVAVRRFIEQADKALGDTPAQAFTPTFAAALWPALTALEADIHRLSLDASLRFEEQAEARAAAVRGWNMLSLGLTVGLSILVLAFAAIALHHLRHQRERRSALEALAAELRQSQRDAQAASEAQSAFLADMSHELRTPFHGLMGMLSLLRETGLSARQVDYLRSATESADRLLAILNDILDLSRLEAGRLTLSPWPTDLRTLLRDVEALVRPQAGAKGLALHFDADPSVPDQVVLDPTRVKQVLFSLLSNAIKFSDHGAVVLDVRCKPEASSAPDGASLDFVVTDSGAGMDAATLARLFTRVGQAHGCKSGRHGGTGLGLEISRMLARLMHGDITVRSTPGEGSVFTFSLPLQAVQPAMPALQAYPAVPQESARALQLLVAEDHPVNRQYLAALLESLGHQAHFTANGQEALQAARERRFDAVLMDLHMPVMDGLAATKAIRALPDRSAAAMPIVALTADAFEQTRDRCLVAGMNDFLTKPVRPQQLASSLRRLFGEAADPAGIGSTGERAQALLASDTQGQRVIDPDALHAAMQAMPRERLALLIHAFLAQGPQTVLRLRAAVRDAQPLELSVNAHAAKGAALNLGLTGLAITATALHEGAAYLPAHEIARLVQRYEDLLPLTRAAVAECGLQLPAEVLLADGA